MSFSVKHLHEAFEKEKSPNVWLAVSTSINHQVRDCIKLDDGSYEIVFYSRPSMIMKDNQGATSTYVLSYLTPPLQNQVARKVVASSITKGDFIYLTDGVFPIINSWYGDINITHNGKISKQNVKCLYVVVGTRYGERLCLYGFDEKTQYLTPMIKHHEIMGIYKRPSYTYIPAEIDGMNVSWFPPLARNVYEYETNYIAALGEKYKETAQDITKNNVYDARITNIVRSVRTEAMYTPQALGENKAVYAMSHYIKTGLGTGTTNKVVTSAPSVVAKVASLPYAAMKAMVDKLKQTPEIKQEV